MNKNQEKNREKNREEIRKCLDMHMAEFRENLNVRLLCEETWESPMPEQVLWIEDIVLTEVTYREKQGRFLIFQKIRQFLFHWFLKMQEKIRFYKERR